MKERMFLLTAVLLAALCAAAAFIPAALADVGEAEEQARRARVNGYLAAQFGEGWETAVAAYADYDLGATAEDGTLFAVAQEDGENALYMLVCADGKRVSAVCCAGAVRRYETPEMGFEMEDTLDLRYADGETERFALDGDGRWHLRSYRTRDGALSVDLAQGPLVEYSAVMGGAQTGGRIAAWPLFATDIETVDVTALPGDEASLRAALTDERGGVRALLAESEMEGARFTAVCAVSDARCALTVFAEWTWDPKAPEETGLCAYRAEAEGGRLATLDMPRWDDGSVCYEPVPTRGEIEGWAQMPRPKTLTLVPVDGEGNEYSEAAMEFALSE